MKFSIIGTGFIFPSHVEAIRDVGGKIIDVVNTAHGEHMWRDMIAQTKADCIVLLTPNDLHVPMAKEAMKQGKIVLSEKPLAFTSNDADALLSYPNIYTVLQIRHHPLVKELKQNLGMKTVHEVEMDISVHRDPEYYTSWKGQKERSGGVLFNLGIHYFDLLLYLFGDIESVSTTLLDDKTGEGEIYGKHFTCKWRVSTDEPRESQRRVFRIDGKDYNFSSKDNLSFENLHRYVYQDLLKSKGVLPGEAKQSIALVEQLYDAYNA